MSSTRTSTLDQPPQFYERPKVHKASIPFRPIVSNIGSISYTIAMYVDKMLAPLVGKTEYM